VTYYPFEYSKAPFNVLTQDQRNVIATLVKNYIADNFGQHVDSIKQLGRHIVAHFKTPEARIRALNDTLDITLENVTFPVPIAPYTTKYQTNLEKYRIKVSISGLLTCDLVTEWLRQNKNWAIRERIIENPKDRSIDLGQMVLYVAFADLYTIKQLPTEYNVYGSFVKIFHKF
jgi:hypothetical protein